MSYNMNILIDTCRIYRNSYDNPIIDAIHELSARFKYCYEVELH